MTDEIKRIGDPPSEAPAAAAAAGEGTTPADAAGPGNGATGGNGLFGGDDGIDEGEASTAPGRSDEDIAELERLQQEMSALNDRHLRLAAEFDNYRKRVERERVEAHTRSQAELVRRLIDVLDDLQRVEHFDPQQVTSESLLEALDLVERKFRQALESAGLEEIRAQGEFFNPEFMEALMTAPAEHEEEDEVVSDVFQKGYRMGNALVRPARVRVKKFEG